MPVINANSVDPDQTPHSAASDWVHIVCQCPIYGTLGTNGLRVASFDKKIHIPGKQILYCWIGLPLK